MVNPASQKECYVQEGAKSETSNRTIPISPRAMEILLTTLGKNGASAGHAAKGFPMKIFAAMQKSLRGGQGTVLWTSRMETHPCHKSLFYKGVDVKILSKLLGHANTAITYKIYIHLYCDGFDDMMNAVS